VRDVCLSMTLDYCGMKDTRNLFVHLNERYEEPVKIRGTCMFI